MKIKLFLSIFLTAVIVKSYPQSKIDSLLSALPRSNGQSKVDIMIQLADMYKLENSNESEDFALRALMNAQDLDYASGIGHAAYYLAYAAYMKGNFNDAEEKIQRAYMIADELNDPHLKIKVYEILALIYEEKEEYNESLSYFSNAYELNNSIKNYVGSGLALLGQGRIYDRMENSELALQRNLAAMQLFQKLGNEAGVAKSAIVVGKNYYYIGEYDSAYHYFTISDQRIQQLNSKALQLELLLEKSHIYRSSNIDSALFYIDRAITLAKTLQRIYLVRELLSVTSDLYSQRGEYQKAYDFHQKYKALDDSILHNQDIPRPGQFNMSLTETIYAEQEKIFRELELLSGRDTKQYRIMTYGFGLLILVIASILAWLLIRYSAQRKAIAKMNTLYGEIENLSREIRHKEKLIKNLRHDSGEGGIAKSKTGIRNNSSELASRAKMKVQDNNDFIAQALQQHIDQQWDKLQGVRDTLRFSGELSDLNSVRVEEWEYVNLDQVCLALIQSNPKLVDGSVNIHHIPAPHIHLYCHRGYFLLHLNCLLQNAIEAIDRKGDIYLDYSYEENKVVVRILDTGCGITADDRYKIFEPFYSTKKQEKHYGLGLSVVLEIMKVHEGVIRVNSKAGFATEICTEFFNNTSGH